MEPNTRSNPEPSEVQGAIEPVGEGATRRRLLASLVNAPVVALCDKPLLANGTRDSRMPETIEVCYIAADSAACDGGCGPLGHPKVYMAVDHTGRVTCAYCGRLFVRDPDRAGQSELLTPDQVAALAPTAAAPPQH
jgi:uncharacterized Zn-finger protein